MDFVCAYRSPLGDLMLASDGEALVGLWFEGQKYFGRGLEGEGERAALPVFASAARWLDQYFAGRDPGVCPPLRPRGTPFQREVWEILRIIPFGSTRTYGDIAAQIARQRGLARFSAQAVGSAVGRNPISLFIPCHRVVGADGSLTGYAGGLDKKRALLRLEGAQGFSQI